MNLALSSSSVSLTPGTSRLIRSISARTPWAICTVFVPDCLVTCRRTPGLPLIRRTRPDVLGRVRDVGDVAQVDRHAGLGQDDEIPDLVEVLELALAAEQERPVALVDLAERDVLVLGAQHVDDAIDRQIERGDLLPRQLDVNLPAQAAVRPSPPRRRARARAAATDVCSASSRSGTRSSSRPCSRRRGP